MAKRGRVFFRGITSENYGLKDFRAAQLAAPGCATTRSSPTMEPWATPGTRRSPGRGGGSGRAMTRSSPRPCRSTRPAAAAALGCRAGDQKEAAFYIHEGRGYETQTGTGTTGNRATCPVDTDWIPALHRERRAGDRPVVKAEPADGLRRRGAGRDGLIGQESSARAKTGRDVDTRWFDRKEVVKPADTSGRPPAGRVRCCLAECTDRRTYDVDAYLLEIPAGNRTSGRAVARKTERGALRPGPDGRTPACGGHGRAR